MLALLLLLVLPLSSSAYYIPRECRCQYPGEEFYPTQRMLQEEGINSTIAPASSNMTNRTAERERRWADYLSLTTILFENSDEFMYDKNSSYFILPPSHAACQRVEFICPGDQIKYPIWPYQCRQNQQNPNRYSMRVDESEHAVEYSSSNNIMGRHRNETELEEGAEARVEQGSGGWRKQSERRRRERSLRSIRRRGGNPQNVPGRSPVLSSSSAFSPGFSSAFLATRQSIFGNSGGGRRGSSPGNTGSGDEDTVRSSGGLRSIYGGGYSGRKSGKSSGTGTMSGKKTYTKESTGSMSGSMSGKKYSGGGGGKSGGKAGGSGDWKEASLDRTFTIMLPEDHPQCGPKEPTPPPTPPPTSTPVISPTATPVVPPTQNPTVLPTIRPTGRPTLSPTPPLPSAAPSLDCTATPTYCCVDADCTANPNSYCFEHVCLRRGVLAFRLTWNGNDDEDLHVITPCGDEIAYTDRVDAFTAGFLDVDNTEGGSPAVENIVFPDNAKAPYGQYIFFIDEYSRRGDPDSWLVEVLVENIAVASFTGSGDSARLQFTGGNRSVTCP